MKTVLRFVFGVCFLCSLLAFALPAQDSTKKQQPPLDFSNDPCGNPLVESQLWSSIKGRVAGVIDGHTLLVTIRHRHDTLRVDLSGIGLDSEGHATGQAKELLSQLLLEKSVEVLVSSSWDEAKKKPTEITGVVNLTEGVLDATGTRDVGLLLLSKGLAKFQDPSPYSMSGNTECGYRHAEAKAQSEKLGIWANRAGA
jgi:endonuclease YncB( thermonuclease family)